MIGSLLALLTFGLPMGIDFTGGTLLEAQFEKEGITNQMLQEALSKPELNLGSVSVLSTDQGGKFLIKMKNIDEQTHNDAKFALKEQVGNFDEISFTTIGPTIGKTLQEKALVAIIVAILVIVLFVAYAFRKIPKRLNSWKFGLIAIVALVHDVLITVGVFSVLSAFVGFEVNTFFITALLTIVGYSVNDTIVIFDRIRENLKKWGKDETFADLTNRSVTESLARSVNTALSTLFTLVALYFFGGESIQYFALALIVGISLGTYSSIFVASPILVMWQKKFR